MTTRSSSRFFSRSLAGLGALWGVWALGQSPAGLPQEPSEEQVLRELAELIRSPVAASSKYQQPLIESPQAMEVIQGRELRAMGVFRLADVLKLMAGADVLDYDGENPILAVRGAISQGYPRSFQILVDGVPLYNESFGNSNLATLPVPLDLVDRVELVRGPSSTIHGANAVTGVLSITTLRPSEGLHGSARYGRGSFGTHRWSATAGYGGAHLSISAGGAGASYRSADAPTQYIATGVPRILDDEKGHEDQHLLRVEGSWGETTLWGTWGEGAKTFSVSHGETGVAGIPLAPFFRDLRHLVALGWGQVWGPTLRTRFQVAANYADVVQGTSPGLAALFRDPGYLLPRGYPLASSTTRSAEFQATWIPNADLVVVTGADARKERAGKAIVNGFPEPIFETASGAFANLRWTFHPEGSLDAGLRAENASLGGARSSPRLVLSWFPAPNQALRIGYYRSTRSPLILEARANFTAYVGGPPTFAQARVYPNPGLRPETATSYELGYRAGVGSLGFDLTVFHMQFDRLIVQVPVPLPPPPPVVVSANTFVNAGTATNKGLEAALGWIPAPGWNTGLNCAWLDARDASNRPSTYAPRFKANLWARYRVGALSGYLAYQHASEVDVDVQPILVSTQRRIPRRAIHQLHGQATWTSPSGLQVGIYARNAARELTEQGGTGFVRLNFLAYTRREWGASLGWRF